MLSCFVEINYDRSLEESITAGNYDLVDLGTNYHKYGTTKHFGIKKAEIKLIHVDEIVSSNTVSSELHKLGLRPVELYELLSIGEQLPNLQRKFTISAIGSRAKWLEREENNFFYPVLAVSDCRFVDSKRVLRLELAICDGWSIWIAAINRESGM